MFEQLSARELEAFFAYARALIRGDVEPPEGVVELGAELEDVIDQMLLMKMTLRQIDHNSVAAVKTTMAVVNPEFLEAALSYIPTARYVM